ncbi:MAG TPA: hypothetical protein VJ848_04905 [Candidatus Angelobacter sp.]|nr:hypothetical protein [Candidatus Angelobacter sp.]
MQLRKIRTSGEPAAAVADFLAPPTQIAAAQAAIPSSPAVTRAQQKHNQWFYQGLLNASHKGALPEEVLKPMCK